MIIRPHDLIVERKGHNESIPEWMKKLRKNLYKSDSLINLFDKVLFEIDYCNAHKVLHLGSCKQ